MVGGKVREHGVRAFNTDDADELLAGGATDAGKTAERDEQRLAPPRADTADRIELRSEVSLLPRLSVERDGKAMGFVANAANQQQRGAVDCQRDGVRADRA